MRQAENRNPSDGTEKGQSQDASGHPNSNADLGTNRGSRFTLTMGCRIGRHTLSNTSPGWCSRRTFLLRLLEVPKSGYFPLDGDFASPAAALRSAQSMVRKTPRISRKYSGALGFPECVAHKWRISVTDSSTVSQSSITWESPTTNLRKPMSRALSPRRSINASPIFCFPRTGIIESAIASAVQPGGPPIKPASIWRCNSLAKISFSVTHPIRPASAYSLSNTEVLGPRFPLS